MKYKDLTGKKFGRLTPLEYISGSRKVQSKWICRCSCGKITKTTTNYLISGHTKSCGCLREEYPIENLIGQRFGRLIVLEFSGTSEEGHSRWLCQCDCGNKKTILAACLRHKQTISCGCYHTEVMKRKRKTHYLTPINERLRKSFEISEWRKSIFKRDGWKCQQCHRVGGTLNAHHILSFAKYPSERTNTNNGITLCEECHKELHRKNKKYG